MGKEAPAWAQVGVEVVEETRRFMNVPRFGRTYKITARLGNGNVRLGGHAGQWRCFEDGSLRLAGTDSYSIHRARHVTDKLRDDLEADRAFDRSLRALHNELTRLEKLARSGDRAAIIAAFPVPA